MYVFSQSTGVSDFQSRIVMAAAAQVCSGVLLLRIRMHSSHYHPTVHKALNFSVAPVIAFKRAVQKYAMVRWWIVGHSR